MTHIITLVGMALAALLLASPASATQWWVMEAAATTDVATPTDRLPTGCNLGSGPDASPASLYERLKGLGERTARIEEEKDGEVYVHHFEHSKHVYARFFRTREACEAAMQAARDRAAEKARKLDKYR